MPPALSVSALSTYLISPVPHHVPPKGALVGDMFMSLIQTCSMAKENPFDYLIALQKNASAVAANPEKWLPWNFRQAIPSPN